MLPVTQRGDVRDVDGNGRRAPLGVLGGMGPLASAEFLKTIYEEGMNGVEQNAPAVVLHSDPSMPDRTHAFLNGNTEAVLSRFVDALTCLEREGVSRIVVCCITIHYLLPRLPAGLRRRVLSLLDVIVDAIRESGTRHLLLCTTGTRTLGLFERHPQWAEVKRHVVLPDDSDQALVHDTIYRVKQNGDVQVLVSTVERLLRKYEVQSFVAGCTEIHFAAKRFGARRSGDAAFGCVDPLLIVAQDVARGRV